MKKERERANEQECERERKREKKRERERRTREKHIKYNLQLPLSASNAKHTTTCNPNFFVAMYLPTNDDLLIIILLFAFILYINII